MRRLLLLALLVQSAGQVIPVPAPGQQAEAPATVRPAEAAPLSPLLTPDWTAGQSSSVAGRPSSGGLGPDHHGRPRPEGLLRARRRPWWLFPAVGGLLGGGVGTYISYRECQKVPCHGPGGLWVVGAAVGGLAGGGVELVVRAVGG